MKRRLSSSATIIVKFIFPAIWLCGWAWLSYETLSFSDEPHWLPILIWGVALAVFYWLGFRLKDVFVDGDYIYISNHFREVRIPLIEIEAVTENFLTNPKHIKIKFTKPTAFGSKIVFTPYAMWFAPLRKHPLVDEINQLVKKKKNALPA
jgi:hypothetical protein